MDKRDKSKKGSPMMIKAEIIRDIVEYLEPSDSQAELLATELRYMSQNALEILECCLESIASEIKALGGKIEPLIEPLRGHSFGRDNG